jgi:four helix bundle protein
MVYSGGAVSAGTERRPSPLNLKGFTHRNPDTPPSNIAEGFGRWSHKDFARFLQIAVASLKETRDLLIEARESGYISEEELQWATILAKRAHAACAGLIRYLKNTPDLR